MKITLAQLNPIAGDVYGNLEKVLKVFDENKDKDLIVYPEMVIAGYYPHDLLLREDFINANISALETLKEKTIGSMVTLAVGVITKNKKAGKPLSNGVVLIQNGKELFSVNKKLLPTYNIFDEGRHFEAGNSTNVFEFMGKKVGFLICEDIWNDDESDYKVNPVKDAVKDGAEIIISLNSSPSNLGKLTQRLSIFGPMCKKYNIPLVYLNQVGGQDEIVFDGRSFILSSNGDLVFSMKGFEEEVVTVIYDGINFKAGSTGHKMDKYEFIYNQIILGMRDYFEKLGIKKAVVGSSGGIDSALVLALAVKAFGCENVKAITMPGKFSSEGSVNDSVKLCDNLNVKLYTHEIGGYAQSLNEGYKKAFDSDSSNLAKENLQARIRGQILMEFSNTTGSLVLSTGNKSELSVGYATLYGDMNGGLNPIGDLYKTEVYELCSYINRLNKKELIPISIIEKEPSAELAEGQKDSDALPEYEVLDAILKLYVEDNLLLDSEKINSKEIVSRINPAVIEDVLRKVDSSEFKRRQAPPIIRVHGKAFGFGRRVPIVKKTNWKIL